MQTVENENIEIKLLLEAIYLKYGYDFRDYRTASLKRRILHQLSASGLSSISEMQHRLIYDPLFFATLLKDLSIHVTEMFRDPSFYRAVRETVVPFLKTYPFLKIWHAGCASGEEVYSMAILLREEGLYERTQIYATDFNEAILEKAKEGIFPSNQIEEYTHNYQKAGGVGTFADYYTAKYGRAMIDKSLKKNVLFATHNLATDGIFSEMHLIMCRNVLIYFNKALQNRVIQLFRDSLCLGGFLCLGAKESLQFSGCVDDFEEAVRVEKIYRKKYT